MLADQLAQRQSAEQMLVLSVVFLLGVAFLIITNMLSVRHLPKQTERTPALKAAPAPEAALAAPLPPPVAAAVRTPE